MVHDHTLFLHPRLFATFTSNLLKFPSQQAKGGFSGMQLNQLLHIMKNKENMAKLQFSDLKDVFIKHRC